MHHTPAAPHVVQTRAEGPGGTRVDDDVGAQGAIDLDDALGVTLDNSPPEGSSGVLVGFFEGAHARRAALLPAAERRAAALAALVKLFGPEAAEPVDYAELNWMDEEFTRGCYGGRLGAGVWTQCGHALAEPCGRVHWAGAETADVWNGYMEGAAGGGGGTGTAGLRGGRHRPHSTHGAEPYVVPPHVSYPTLRPLSAPASAPRPESPGGLPPRGPGRRRPSR
ncbi:FAD-dependent oxidoreductase [Streptomyces sp. NPDC002176]|uniref:FAD-dependent oxidoreductase n=1 Tax=Streptomyces sp. NPDC002176 TaxID=3364634 RepID=UPI00384B951C